MGLWDQLFDRLGQSIAQILLTRNDIADRAQYLNAQNTMAELLAMGVIPIVNENDTLAVSEIVDRFGDNDTLSAITSRMVQADYLFLMTDVDCLYDKNPRAHPDAKPIEVVSDIAALAADTSTAGSALGTGGMGTKIVAARLATAAGVTTIITRSSKPGNLVAIVGYLEEQRAARRRSTAPVDDLHGVSLDDEKTSAFPTAPLHTRFLPAAKPIGDRSFWLLHGLAPHGTVYVDPGAARALADKAGLLSVGIVDADGSFAQQECVRLVEVPRPPRESAPTSPTAAPETHAASSSSEGAPAEEPLRPLPSRLPSHSGPGSGAHTPTHPSALSPWASHPAAREIGRAVVNYSTAEVRRIAGLRSSEIAGVLGYADSEYVALRENIALLPGAERSAAAKVKSAGIDEALPAAGELARAEA